MKNLGIQKVVMSIILIILIIATANVAYSAIQEPNSEQYMELKLVEIQETSNGKQMILEWWSHNVNFKGLDLRFQYDKTKVKPSNLENNQEIYDSHIFEFAEDFAPYMDYFVMNDKEGENIVRMNMSLLPEKLEENTNKHIKQLEDKTYYVDTTGDVLIGKMSFKVYNEEIDKTTLSLKSSSTDSSPLTGIKINIDGKDSYENQTVFRFTLLSNNAYLMNLEKSIYNKEESGTQKYTQIENFNKETFEYEIILNENKEYISLKPTLEDKKATIKVKVPKKEENGNIIYEEKELENGIIEVKLNELGEEDTKIEIIVTAEDRRTIKTYTVKVHRPFATITGQIQLGTDLREIMEQSYDTRTKYIADISIYEANKFNWDGIIDGETKLEDLNEMQKLAYTQSEEEGEYTIYVIPGEYDCLIERLGFLAHVKTNLKLKENDTINLGKDILLEGDVDRSGVIELKDKVEIIQKMDLTKEDDEYDERYDFGQKGFIDLSDKVSVVRNVDNLIEIKQY